MPSAGAVEERDVCLGVGCWQVLGPWEGVCPLTWSAPVAPEACPAARLGRPALAALVGPRQVVLWVARWVVRGDEPLQGPAWPRSSSEATSLRRGDPPLHVTLPHCLASGVHSNVVFVCIQYKVVIATVKREGGGT